MAVEISGVPVTPANNKQVEPAGTNKVGTVASNTNSPNTADNVAAAPADSFTLSQQAETLRVIESSVNTQPDVDGARVESLKSAIDAGQYDINPLRVAEKLIELETQFVA